MDRYTTLEAIDHLTRNNKTIFVRVDDNDFEMYRNIYGLLMMRIGKRSKPMPLFNYSNDMWIKKQEI